MSEWMNNLLLCKIRDPQLASRLKNMIEYWTTQCAPVLWGLDKCPEMVDHGSKHAQSVFMLLSKLLSVNSAVLETLNDGEIFCLTCAAWLHDIGLRGNEVTKKSEDVRKIHGKLTAEHLNKDWDKLHFFSRDEASLVGKICIYHQGKAPLIESHLEAPDIDKSLEPIPVQRMLGEYPIRMRFIAALLSLLDVCDTQHGRMISDFYADHKVEGAYLEINELKRELELAKTDEDTLNLTKKIKYMEDQIEDHYKKHLSVRKVHFVGSEIVIESALMLDEKNKERPELALREIEKEIKRSGPTLKKYGINVSVRFIKPDEVINELDSMFYEYSAASIPKFDDFIGREYILKPKFRPMRH